MNDAKTTKSLALVNTLSTAKLSSLPILQRRRRIYSHSMEVKATPNLP